MISVPPQGAGKGGGTTGPHAVLTIDCSEGRRMGSPRGKKRESGSPGCGPTTPGSWEEAMSQMSRELHVICRSPDNSSRFQTSSPTSPKFMSSYSPPSPKMLFQPSSPSATNSIGPPSPVTIPEVVATPSAPETRTTQTLSVKHQQTEENLRQKLSSIVCRGLPRRSSSVNDYNTGSAPPKVVKSSQVPRKNSGGFMPHYKECIDVGRNRQIEDLHVVIEDRKLKVYADDEKGGITSDNKRPSDLIKVVTIPDEVTPQKLICIMRDGVLHVRETRSRPTGQRGKAAASVGGTRQGMPESVRYRSGSGGTKPPPSQGPIVINDDGSQLLKLVLHIPSGYNMQDLVIKTIDDQLIVSGKKLGSLLDVTPEQEVLPPREAADALAASVSPGHCPIENEFVKVFELPSTVDPYSITAHVTERCQLVIQAVLSSRCRCGSY